MPPAFTACDSDVTARRVVEPSKNKRPLGGTPHATSEASTMQLGVYGEPDGLGELSRAIRIGSRSNSRCDEIL
jgi:hypothetical protein